MRNRFIMGVGVALALATSAPTAAKAQNITAGQWYTFCFGATNSFATSGSSCLLGTNPTSVAAPAPPWTYIGAGSITVLDGFFSGDRFQVFDGASLGLTSAPINGADCSNDITACLSNSNVSKGTFAFGAGSHSFTIQTSISPFDGGAAFFKVTAATTTVPEPESIALVAAGLFGVAVAARRKKA